MSIGNKINGLRLAIKGKLAKFNDISDGTIQVNNSLEERTRLLNEIINIDAVIANLSKDYEKPITADKKHKRQKEEYKPMNLKQKFNQIRVKAIQANDWQTVLLLTKKIKKLKKNASK